MNFIKESFNYKITIIGGKELCIEGHKGLSHYNENEIGVRVKGGNITLTGDGLYVNEINEDELIIKGKILSLGVSK